MNMFDSVIIHVGLHKTASTYFQDVVWPQVEGYNLITRPYTQHNHAFNKLQYADESLYCEEEVKTELDKVDENNIIISDESLSGKPVFFSYINRRIVSERLNSLFRNAKVVLFIRDQKDIIKSHYSQYIKQQYGVKRPENFFYKPTCNYEYEEYKKNNNASLESLYYDTTDYHIHLDSFKYTKLIDMYRDVFEEVNVFLFENLAYNPESIEKRLSGILGEEITVNKSSKRNESLSGVQKRIERTVNRITYGILGRRLTMGTKIAVRKILAYFPDVFKNKISDDIDKYVQDYYEHDNERLRSMLPGQNWSKINDKYV